MSSDKTTTSALLFLAVAPYTWSCTSSTSAPGPAPTAVASSNTDKDSETDAAEESASPASNSVAAAELGSFGIDLSAQNPDVQPGDDFFEHANGAWLKSYKLKADEIRYGTFMKLRDRSEERVKAIIDEVSRGNPKPGSVEQQIGDFFASFMAVDALNEKGIAPLKEDLQAIDQIANREELVDAFGQNWRTRTQSPIDLGISPDRKDPDRMVISIAHSGLGLPDRDFYLEDAERFQTIRKAYEDNIAEVLGFTGLSAPEAQAAAKKVLELETAIAKEHWSQVDLRDAEKTYNPITLAELLKRYPNYMWQRHLKAAKVDTEGVEQLNITTPSALRPLAQLLKTTPLTTWKPYLKYHLVRSHAFVLSEEIDDTVFGFFGKVLNGQAEQRDRWKRGVGAISGLGQAVGKLYVERHFSPEAKEKMDDLVKNLREALRQRINDLPWMGEETKRQALAKLETFNPKIGYPDKWRDFSSIEIKRDDVLGNVRRVGEYWYQKQLDDLKRPTDKDEWFMTPQTVNAYYNPSYNEIVFPAAILQPPFFDLNADPAVNYGAIGAVIGHEIGHGFDDQGSKFDEMGVQRNWWTEEDRKKFEERTQVLVAQYAVYEPIEGQKVNGELTLGENIGDLGGLSMAYHAYKLSLDGKEAPVIDGLTGDQRFFLAWAQAWRSKARDEFTVRVLKSDPHSPPQYRVNGVVRNMDAWYEAFNVQKDNELYLPPEERVKIW